MSTKAPKQFRLTRRSDIDRLFAEGAGARDRLATMIARPNDLGFARVAVGVSKRHGNAVRRNRVKRLCREATRLSRADLPVGYDYMLLPRPGVKLTLAALQDTVVALARRAAGAQDGSGRDTRPARSARPEA